MLPALTYTRLPGMFAFGSVTTTFEGAGVAFTTTPPPPEPVGDFEPTENGIQPAKRAAVTVPTRTRAIAAMAGATSPVRGSRPYGSAGPRRDPEARPRPALSPP